MLDGRGELKNLKALPIVIGVMLLAYNGCTDSDDSPNQPNENEELGGTMPEGTGGNSAGAEAMAGS
jgi:hypothetical protein